MKYFHSVSVKDNKTGLVALEMAYWCGQNLSHEAEFTTKTSMIGTVIVEFILCNEEDVMAFKLRWQ